MWTIDLCKCTPLLVHVRKGFPGEPHDSHIYMGFIQTGHVSGTSSNNPRGSQDMQGGALCISTPLPSKTPTHSWVIQGHVGQAPTV